MTQVEQSSKFKHFIYNGTIKHKLSRTFQTDMHNNYNNSIKHNLKKVMIAYIHK